LNSSTKAANYFVNFFDGMKEKELFVCAFLNNQNNLIHSKIVSTGTVSEAAVYPREITKLALLYDANSIVLSHNHPGGSLKPSSADIAITQKIIEALGTVNIHVVDHIIVGGAGYFSFAESGLIGPTKSSGSRIKENNVSSVKEKLQTIKNSSHKNSMKDVQKTEPESR
jgi:DNA repair protein RadC